MWNQRDKWKRKKRKKKRYISDSWSIKHTKNYRIEDPPFPLIYPSTNKQQKIPPIISSPGYNPPPPLIYPSTDKQQYNTSDYKIPQILPLPPPTFIPIYWSTTKKIPPIISLPPGYNSPPNVLKWIRFIVTFWSLIKNELMQNVFWPALPYLVSKQSDISPSIFKPFKTL